MAGHHRQNVFLTANLFGDTAQNMNGQSFSPRFVPLSYTYNAFGQMLSATGPRTDVVDTTTYTYDASTGNLTRMTDAVGNKTTFVATARVSHR